jgi:hypothetical protein
MNKIELKKQLNKLGVSIEGNHVKRKEVKHILETLLSTQVIAEEKQAGIYYKADWYAPINTKKPKIEQRKAHKKPEGWFETEQEAVAKFLEAQKIAKQKAVEIEKELTELQKRLGFSIGYTMEGDTYGIHTDYLYFCVKVDGYEFKQKMED